MSYSNNSMNITSKIKAEELLITQLYKKLHAIIDIETICRETVKALLDFFKTNTIFIAVYYPEKQSFNIPYYVSDGKEQQIEDFPHDTGLISLIIKDQKPLIIQTNAHDFFVAHHAIVINRKREPKSWIGIPIVKDKDLLGLISLQNYDFDNYFSDKDIETLTIIANSIAESIKTARDYAFMKRQAENSALLISILNSLQTTLDLESFFAIFTEKLKLLVHHSTIAVFFLDAEKHCYIRTKETSSDYDSYIPDTISYDTFISNDKCLCEGVIDNTGTGPVASTLLKNSNNSIKLMLVTITTTSQIAGFAIMLRSNNDNDFTLWELDSSNALSKHAATIYNNIMIFKEVQFAKIEAEEANKIKSQFLATMSHELRTPLNSIINFAFLLLQEVEGPITPQQRELLSRIELSGKHLLSLINDILDLAKIESGKMELYLEETDSNIIIKEMIGVTESLIQNKPIKLIYAAEDSLPPVKADRVRLRQILLNILSNAVKFTDEGTITLKIIRQDDFLVFSIIDTGIGISESDVNKAFAEFVQLDTGYARKAGGTGLGLPIAKRFVELHGGTISITSEKHKGTTVSFTIPIYRTG